MYEIPLPTESVLLLTELCVVKWPVSSAYCPNADCFYIFELGWSSSGVPFRVDLLEWGHLLPQQSLFLCWKTDDSSMDADSPSTGIEDFVVSKLSARRCATTWPVIVATRLAVSERLIPDNPVANRSVFGPSSGATTKWVHSSSDTRLAVSKLLKSGNPLCIISAAWCSLRLLLGWLFLDVCNPVAGASNCNGSSTDYRKRAGRFRFRVAIVRFLLGLGILWNFPEQTGNWNSAFEQALSMKRVLYKFDIIIIICKVTETHYSRRKKYLMLLIMTIYA